MKAVFNNLKPFIAYWISFAVYIIISLFETFSYTTCAVTSLTVYIILNILIGYTTDIKEMRWGIILIELQLFICAICFSPRAGASDYPIVASAGNIFYSTFFDSFNKGFKLSILLPLLLLGIGLGLRILKKENSM